MLEEIRMGDEDMQRINSLLSEWGVTAWAEKRIAALTAETAVVQAQKNAVELRWERGRSRTRSAALVRALDYAEWRNNVDGRGG
jgi:hypothetical protein